MGSDGTVLLYIFIFDVEWSVGRICRNVTEERFFRMRLDKTHAFSKKYVCTITFELPWDSIHEKGVVEIVIAPDVAGVADNTTRVIDRPFKTAFMRFVGLAVSQVPLAEMTCSISGAAKSICQCPLILAQQRAASDRKPHPWHCCSSARSADRAGSEHRWCLRESP